MLSTQDIAELESKYKRYILKKRFKIVSMFLVITLTAIGLYFIYLNNQPIKTTKHQIKKSTKKIIKKEQTKKNITLPIIEKTPKENLKHIENSSNKEQKMVIKEDHKPQIPTIIKEEQNSKKEKESKKENSSTNKYSLEDKIQKEEKNDLYFHLTKSSDSSYEEFSRGSLTLNLDKTTVTQKVKKSINNSVFSAKPKVSKKIKEEKKVSNSTIKIEMNEINSIKYLKEKYAKTHNIIFALMLCEEYYSLKNYKETLKWSIIANDLDNQSERSWIWFAKSKYRLNQKNDAIKALKAYLQTNESEAVHSLLEKIENGELDD